MTFEKLFNIIGDNSQAKALILNISSDTIEVPYIMEKTVEILNDDSVFINIISDSNKKALTNMLVMYFNSCWDIYIDDIKLEPLIKGAKIEMYKVEAPNGLRFATTKEIAQGVKELVSEMVYPATEDVYKKLCLLQWTFSGISFYFKEAGYKLTYENGSKQPKESFYELIMKSANELVELFNWCSISSNLEQAKKQINKLKGSKSFKYATYEKDEIEESISIKQLIYNIDKTFPRNSDNMEYRRAIALVIKGKFDIKSLSPMDISFLRKVYDARALERNGKTEVSENKKLKEECELLIKERYNGKIKQDHFAYKIIDTLKRGSYKSCTMKQYKIIKDALDIVNKDNKKDIINNEEQIILDDDMIVKGLSISEDSMTDMSDALGSGLFEDME